jgi:UDP-N-acetylmuramate dehydrogenase
VGAGESWDKFVSRSVMARCAGVECLSGIPGSVGGTPVQNVGAYGQEVAETIASVLVLDLKDGELRELCREACGFSYRSSIFNTSERGRFIVLRVSYALAPDGEPRITYADLKRHFAGRESFPSLSETREAVRHIRALKGMLIVPGDADCLSAGSFFKNPVLSKIQHEDLKQRAAARGLTVPSYPALETRKKVSAAWLVERSGFAKRAGYRESRRSYRRGDSGIEGTDSTSCGRNLGRATRTGTGDGRFVSSWDGARLPAQASAILALPISTTGGRTLLFPS